MLIPINVRHLGLDVAGRKRKRLVGLGGQHTRLGLQQDHELGGAVAEGRLGRLLGLHQNIQSVILVDVHQPQAWFIVVCWNQIGGELLTPCGFGGRPRAIVSIDQQFTGREVQQVPVPVPVKVHPCGGRKGDRVLGHGGNPLAGFSDEGTLELATLHLQGHLEATGGRAGGGSQAASSLSGRCVCGGDFEQIPCPFGLVGKLQPSQGRHEELVDPMAAGPNVVPPTDPLGKGQVKEPVELRQARDVVPVARLVEGVGPGSGRGQEQQFQAVLGGLELG